jgi:hypothetical protein
VPSVLLTALDLPASPVDHGVFPADDPGTWAHADIHPGPAAPSHHGFGAHG